MQMEGQKRCESRIFRARLVFCERLSRNNKWQVQTNMPVFKSGLKVKGGRRGFALLMLLIGVAILFLLYALQTGALNPFAAFQGTEADRYSDPEAYPWEEGHLFIDKTLDSYDVGGRRPPFPSQPGLTEPIRYTADVYGGNERRGRIKLIIRTDGDVSGSWTADFMKRSGVKELYETVRESKKGERVNIFNGNIAPLKIYKDQRGEDKSKLYFITMGSFLLRERMDGWTIGGTIYVTGWIDKDYNAAGELALLGYKDGEPFEQEIFKWGPVEPAEGKGR